MQSFERLALFLHLLLSGGHLLLKCFDLLPDLANMLLDILRLIRRNVADSFIKRLSPGRCKSVRRDLHLNAHLGLKLRSEELRLAFFANSIHLHAAEEDNSCRCVS